MATKPTMPLEEAATHLHRMTSFFASLGTLEEIIATARSVDNIKNLAAERMEAAEKARVKMADAQSKLAAFELASAKKQKEIENQLENAEASLRARLVDIEAEVNTRKMQQEAELKKMQEAYSNNVSQLSTEIEMLKVERDDMQQQVLKVEASLAALRKKVEGLL